MTLNCFEIVSTVSNVCQRKAEYGGWVGIVGWLGVGRGLVGPIIKNTTYYEQCWGRIHYQARRVNAEPCMVYGLVGVGVLIGWFVSPSTTTPINNNHSLESTARQRKYLVRCGGRRVCG